MDSKTGKGKIAQKILITGLVSLLAACSVEKPEKSFPEYSFSGVLDGEFVIYSDYPDQHRHEIFAFHPGLFAIRYVDNEGDDLKLEYVKEATKGGFLEWYADSPDSNQARTMRLHQYAFDQYLLKIANAKIQVRPANNPLIASNISPSQTANPFASKQSQSF
jgi:hypothetical protein